jgi:hypothetical protein
MPFDCIRAPVCQNGGSYNTIVDYLIWIRYARDCAKARTVVVPVASDSCRSSRMASEGCKWWSSVVPVAWPSNSRRAVVYGKGITKGESRNHQILCVGGNNRNQEEKILLILDCMCTFLHPFVVLLTQWTYHETGEWILSPPAIFFYGWLRGSCSSSRFRCGKQMYDHLMCISKKVRSLKSLFLVVFVIE